MLHQLQGSVEAFSDILIDCVGPLPKSKSGNQYLLTIMCKSTRFPEAIPLRNIKAQTIIKALTKFFCFVGVPKTCQHDQGTNFMSKIFQQVLYEMGIQDDHSTAYHPESQGALERFHQTLKSMLKKYCQQYDKDWDNGVHFVLFAAREAVQESLGFSPFELVFGHSVRGPLLFLKEKWLNEKSQLNLLDYVSDFKERLFNAVKIAQENMTQSQSVMKKKYDKKAKIRHFLFYFIRAVVFSLKRLIWDGKKNQNFITRFEMSDFSFFVIFLFHYTLRLCHVFLSYFYSVEKSFLEIRHIVKQVEL